MFLFFSFSHLENCNPNLLDLQTEKWILLDGNHRLTEMKEQNFPHVQIQVIQATSKITGCKITKTSMLQLARMENVANEGYLPFSM